jgi:hypothetical protein
LANYKVWRNVARLIGHSANWAFDKSGFGKTLFSKKLIGEMLFGKTWFGKMSFSELTFGEPAVYQILPYKAVCPDNPQKLQFNIRLTNLCILRRIFKACIVHGPFIYCS